jgi:hypothetical protein
MRDLENEAGTGVGRCSADEPRVDLRVFRKTGEIF